MTSRERIRKIVDLQAVGDRPGFWMGNPNNMSIAGICTYFNVPDLESVRKQLHDELFWVPADKAYAVDSGNWTVFDGWEGACADCLDKHDLETIEWPNPEHADFEPIVAELAACGDRYRLGGMWAPFFHDISAFMGMEEYFIAMYERPQFVHALTQRLVDFYVATNKRFFSLAREQLDGYFFGNDLGSQISTLLSPEMFETFLRPYMQQLIDVAKSFGLQVVLHSCGSVSSLIPQFIKMGVHALHPVQIKASQMQTEILKQYKNHIAFIGGIDTQELLRLGSEEEIVSEVRRITVELGPHLVISPSHESILPDVPPSNLGLISKTVYLMATEDQDER